MTIKVDFVDRNDKVISGQISDDKDETAFSAQGDELVTLGVKEMRWRVGDQIRVRIDQPNQYLWVQLDETLNPSLIYLAQKEWRYTIPLSETLAPSQLDTSFRSKRHYVIVRKASKADIVRYQNLALNPHDQHEATGAYPHASANVETRGESVFFAKNVIDGKLANLSHGEYPFQCWGIGGRADAELKVDFGRDVELDCIKLLYRGDYPHDSYWVNATIEFSDGSEKVFDTTNSLEFQSFSFLKIQTSWIKLKNLTKAQDNSDFPALTQIEAYGNNIG
ncbi:hypothetical protein FEZ41_12585 [Lentilactobacillus parafarraginis]|uniref:Carbohydrate-binding protein n=2 Tax=Lentilactobacillus parafarraginis TaxID=390842 RepID=A0A0R1YRY1_9LACO|nr:hypothetical protein [Lentilactobacillus parafarraginis]KRM42012.1 hypothetical protein FD47_GL001994 [Lentilactobacillus parafarraginis DSM 18390 = JCM 14109]TLQ16741.1 hypothetical protein FEZ41_12585 [Lentilactobacillus parafarraginis]